MFKDNLLGLGGLLATIALLGACGAGDIGDSAGEARGGPESGAFDGGVEQTPEGTEFGEDGGPGVVEGSGPTPTPPGDTHGRGPTGQWPAGFPAYTTAADIVTNGTNSGLTSALNSAACSSGCVIEHPGNAALTVSSRAGIGEIVVRPPIGERKDYTMGSVEIQVDNVLFAGFAGGNGSLLVQGGSNSGFAWIDIDGPGGTFGVYCYHGSTSGGLFYEIVYRQYAPLGSEDRGVIRGDGGGTCNVDIRGSILTGTPSPPPSHADTLQNYNPGGSTNISVSDSVVWSSWDKCFQNEGGDNPMILTNVFVMTPGYSEQLWQGPPIAGPLDGYFHTTAAVEYHDSTLVGAGNSSWPIPVWNSELYNAGTYTDKGGNTTLGSLPSPPTPPTDTQLDAIWSP